jgi:hypothetical protein
MPSSLLRRISEQYFSKNPSVEGMRDYARSGDADPLKAFADACREEFAFPSGRV